MISVHETFFFLSLFIESTSHVTQCYPIAAKLLNPVRRKHAREAAFIIQAHFRSVCYILKVYNLLKIYPCLENHLQ